MHRLRTKSFRDRVLGGLRDTGDGIEGLAHKGPILREDRTFKERQLSDEFLGFGK
jgi:hypothetical protein